MPAGPPVGGAERHANIRSPIRLHGRATPRAAHPPRAPAPLLRLRPPVPPLPPGPEPPPGAAAADLPGPQPPPVPPACARDGPGWLPRRNRQREDRLLRDHDLAREDAFPRSVLRTPRDAEPRGRAAGARAGVRSAPSPARDRPLRRGLPRPPRASAVHEVRDVPTDGPVHRRGKADEADSRRPRATTGRTHREVHNTCARHGGRIRSPTPCGPPRYRPTLLRHGRQGFADL